MLKKLNFLAILSFLFFMYTGLGVASSIPSITVAPGYEPPTPYLSFSDPYNLYLASVSPLAMDGISYDDIPAGGKGCMYLIKDVGETEVTANDTPIPGVDGYKNLNAGLVTITALGMRLTAYTDMNLREFQERLLGAPPEAGVSLDAFIGDIFRSMGWGNDYEWNLANASIWLPEPLDMNNLVSIKVNLPSPFSMDAGTSVPVSAYCEDSHGTLDECATLVNWDSTDIYVAYVDKPTATLYALAEGSADILAYYGILNSIPITINVTIPEVYINKAPGEPDLSCIYFPEEPAVPSPGKFWDDFNDGTFEDKWVQEVDWETIIEETPEGILRMTAPPGKRGGLNSLTTFNGGNDFFFEIDCKIFSYPVQLVLHEAESINGIGGNSANINFIPVSGNIGFEENGVPLDGVVIEPTFMTLGEFHKLGLGYSFGSNELTAYVDGIPVRTVALKETVIDYNFKVSFVMYNNTIDTQVVEWDNFNSNLEIPGEPAKPAHYHLEKTGMRILDGNIYMDLTPDRQSGVLFWNDPTQSPIILPADVPISGSRDIYVYLTTLDLSSIQPDYFIHVTIYSELNDVGFMQFLIDLDENMGIPGQVDAYSLAFTSDTHLPGSTFTPTTLPTKSLGSFSPFAPPVANAGVDQTQECTSYAGASVILDGSGSTDPDSTPNTNDDIISFEWFEDYGLPSEEYLGEGELILVTLSHGQHNITLLVTDSGGLTDTDDVIIMVYDTTPPELSVTVNPDTLWPPNHKLVQITTSITVSDICDPSPNVVLTSITSNEPDNGVGDGNTTGDIVVDEEGNIFLRAERSGMGDGRVYTIIHTAVDSSNNSSEAESTVTVPHDMGKGEKERYKKFLK